ncbi:MAG: MOSC N-terminal beta barrel domain-containing protein [Cyanobacteria bacterium P01_D01_bin.105]
MSELTLSELYIYPIKSAAGIAMRKAQMTARGLQHDRRWMVVDARGKFMTQRRFPQMALISVALEDGLKGELVVNAPGMETLVVPLMGKGDVSEGNGMEVEVWGDRCKAISVSAESKAWFSQFLETDCQLVYMPDDAQRPTEHGKLGPDNLVSFADAFPYLLISEASLNGLNQKLSGHDASPVSMDRFRPNLVISGASKPHAEDAWQQISISEAVFDLPKLCARCSIPNVEQQTGDRGKEPTKTLSTYRFWDKGIWFGKNGLQTGGPQNAVLRVGDEIRVLRE